MTKQLPTTAIVCSDYQKLLEEAKRARDIWDDRRTEICNSRLVGKETGDELLRLQANYAGRTRFCGSTCRAASAASLCRELRSHK
jgi:hypothetical protein